MNILDLIEKDGIQLKKTAATNGGEWAGRCAFCGGRDRFRVWPQDRGGRFWCRGCGKHGDAVQYLRDSRGMGFREACELLGVRIDKTRREVTGTSRRRTRASFTPREAAAPPALWQDKATAFFTETRQILMTHAGAREWLRGRGLTEFSIDKLGWNPAEKYRDRPSWGLPSERRCDGRERKLWLPAGCVIPLFSGGKVTRLRVRRADPGDGPRYVIASGSSAAPMRLNMDRGAAVIVESELDALLLSQEAGDLAGVVALGNAQAKPDRITHEALTRATVILVSLDTDTAGAKAAWGFWPATYGDKARRWPTPIGKDPSDAWGKGLDIGAWIQAGIDV